MPYRRVLSAFTAPVNHDGYPALAVPPSACPAFPNELPPALQVIGRRGGEHLLVDIGLALEAAGFVAFRWPEGCGAPA